MNSTLTLVLMAGLSGSGKSTLAAALDHELRWHHINKDRYREVLIEQGLDEEKAGRIAYELAFATARGVLTESKASVILDSSALYKFTLENAMHIVKTVANARLKVILCVADRDMRHERMRNRTPQDSAIRIDPETIADYLQLFKHLPSDTLTLYTFDSIEKCLAIAMDYLTN